MLKHLLGVRSHKNRTIFERSSGTDQKNVDSLRPWGFSRVLPMGILITIDTEYSWILILIELEPTSSIECFFFWISILHLQYPSRRRRMAWRARAISRSSMISSIRASRGISSIWWWRIRDVSISSLFYLIREHFPLFTESLSKWVLFWVSHTHNLIWHVSFCNHDDVEVGKTVCFVSLSW